MGSFLTNVKLNLVFVQTIRGFLRWSDAWSTVAAGKAFLYKVNTENNHWRISLVGTKLFIVAADKSRYLGSLFLDMIYHKKYKHPTEQNVEGNLRWI